MTSEKDEFNVSSWWAKSPVFVIKALRAQLEAAAVIWPELDRHALTEGKSRSVRGAKGGHARAKSLPAERRSEIAAQAANARWKAPETDAVGDQSCAPASTEVA